MYQDLKESMAMNKVTWIPKTSVLGYRTRGDKDPILGVRILTTLKQYYVGMFESRYGANIIHTIPTDWGYRVRVIMDIPIKNLSEVIKFSSINGYKIVYTIRKD